VTRNYSEKVINKILDLVSTPSGMDEGRHDQLLQEFYETTLTSLLVRGARHTRHRQRRRTESTNGEHAHHARTCVSRAYARRRRRTTGSGSRPT
jgi:hypothetical protein